MAFPLVGAVLGAAAIGAGGNIIGGQQAAKSAREQWDANARLQYDFAQNSIRWRVEDALRSGVHPLFALSANTPTYTPSSYVDPMGQAIANAGQDLSQIPLAQEKAALMELQYERELQAKTLLQEQIIGQRIDNQKKNEEMLYLQGWQPGTWRNTTNFEKFYGLSQGDLSMMGQANAPYVTQTPQQPMFHRYDSPWGPMLLMKSQEGPTESFDVGLDGRILTIYANVAYYGPGWLDRMLSKGPRWIRETMKESPDSFLPDALQRGIDFLKGVQ